MVKALAVLIVMLIINVFMVNAILKASIRVTEKVNRHFMEKITNIVPVETNNKNAEKIVMDDESKVVYEQVPVYKVDTENHQAIYKSSDYRNSYKSIKEKMAFDTNDIIKDVINSNETSDENKSSLIIELAKILDTDTVYNLSTLTSLEQEEILRQVLNAEQFRFVDDFKRTNSDVFNVVAFSQFVSSLAKKEDPNFYIKTGFKEDYYDDINKNVVTVHDDSITEGVKIVHKDKVYDYSI